MSTRFDVVRSAVREHISYDLGLLGWPAGIATLAASNALRAAGRSGHGFGLLFKSHNRAFAAGIDRTVLETISACTRRERTGSPTGLWDFYQQVVDAAVAAQGRNPDPRRYVGSRILVVKSATSAERGVIVVDYQYVLPLLAGLFNLPAISDRYDLVLEPSWADVCAPEILLFTRLNRPVYVQTVEPRDHAVLKALDSNLRVVPIAANWWVDPRRAAPQAGPRDIDVIMVAAWADIKRHWRVFRALADLRRRGHRLKTVLVGYRYDRSREDIENLADYFGVKDQVETFERISQDEVNALLARSKVHVLWSRRECANRAIIEAMMADVPVIVREGLTFGYRYPYLNDQTGRFVPERDLADAMLEMIETRSRYSPREWVLQNMTCVHATRALEGTLRDARSRDGEPWTGELTVKTSTLDTQRYFNPEERERFDSDYRFLTDAILK